MVVGLIGSFMSVTKYLEVETMKKVGLILLSVLLLTGMVLPVMADDDEDVYYLTMCSGSNLTDEQKTECQNYAAKRNSELQNELNEIPRSPAIRN